MTKVSKFMRKLFRKESEEEGSRGLQLRLRKAVTLGKARQVAALLDEGASPVWMENETTSRRRFRRRDSYPCQLNALLLACRCGDDDVLSLLLDAFFEEPQVLAHFSRAMYCLVVRHGHWKAFQRLQQRRVPMTSVSSRSSTDSTESPTSVASTQLLSEAAMEHVSSKLPLPIFVAAEHGRHHILAYLLDHYPHDWAQYTFDGHSLLSVATINGHYECVRVLLDRQVATGRSLDAAVALARRHRQAHILVLLTSCLPEFASDPEPTVASEFDDDMRRSSLVAISSPINYTNPAEDMDRVQEMRIRAEMQREQRQTGMMWFLDGREPVEDMQRRVQSHGLNADGFAVLQSARDAAPNSNSSYTSEQEEESWYAVKSNEKNHDLLTSDEEERAYESMFSVHEEADELPPVSEERHKVMPAPRSSSSLRPGRSRKLISVRSRGFQQHRLLEAIEEHPAGEIET
ncbi:uncharacterized protein PITG_19108 [Phytophthora infestans T30-4]|uniref:Uncharacterized protein n=1 Tax=Phytophthora infestans (strain T30-4) TaxID=403677 RepID=D0NYV0_PHYIT|nr:uncharacterized protein PITG_19108 [Phytophthora infestans T30-4]EEY68733.1 conserved hypothetical protein [Phytophthora infestans T30-4]|eukprot:XP_002997425.1 conserved hypothetical protein [Phytophthora infestans T30-4]